MILKTVELKKILKYTKMCLSSNSLIPILSHICFKDNKVLVFNGIESLVIDYETGLNCAIPGKLLCDFIEDVYSDTIDIIQMEGKVKVKIGKATAYLEMIPIDKFIYTQPETRPEIQISINNDFIVGMKKCLISASLDNTKINQYGITFNNNCLYSTDGNRIAKYKLQEEVTSDENFKIMLPRGFCEIFNKTISDSACTMSFSDKYISTKFQINLGEEVTDAETVTKFKNIKLYTELFADVKFLNYEQFTDISIDNTDCYLSNDFKNPVNNCNLFLNGLSEKFVEFNITDNIEIKAVGKLGNYEDILDTKVLVTMGAFKVDVELLKQLLNNVTFIKFIKETNRVVIVGKEGNYLHLLGSFYIKD